MARYQTHASSCGPAALRNALSILGFHRSEEELIKLCRTTTDGTSAKSLVRAVSTLKESCSLEGPGEIKEKDGDIAMLRLLEALRNGRPIICCVRTDLPWDHYAIASGLLGSAGPGLRVVCEDSGSLELTKYRTVPEFVEWWRGPETERKPFYGIVL